MFSLSSLNISLQARTQSEDGELSAAKAKRLAKHFHSCYQVIQDLLEAEAESGYQVDKLLEALD
jgi:hypothetical protein